MEKAIQVNAEELGGLRRKEKWYLENLNLKNKTKEGFLVDSNWIEAWLQFLNEKYIYLSNISGPRPINDINKYLIKQETATQVTIRTDRKLCLVVNKLWDILRDKYTSRLAIIKPKSGELIAKVQRLGVDQQIKIADSKNLEIEIFKIDESSSESLENIQDLVLYYYISPIREIEKLLLRMHLGSIQLMQVNMKATKIA